ncbi:MAG: XRE family transcriptional regulator [Corticimicrobacter sp.]|uniref:helix-turn-helix domain-containing protein n=1 Tax=Corticimicrobacter sp. TaxID=2678536 RepID=UPI0032D9B135
MEIGQKVAQQATHAHTASIGDTTIDVGARLRQARLAKGLSIQEVADRVGVSKSFISRFERDVVNASVSTLLKICDVLDVRPGQLFEPPVTKFVPADQRPPINLGGSRMREYLIGGAGNEHMLAIFSIIEPGGGSGDEPYTLDARSDMVHVQTGSLSVTVGDQVYIMQPGDTLTFPPSIPHTWKNPSATETCTALWVIVPPPV